jgi:heme exporter protein D
MMWESWNAFWSMGGRGFFVWGSYGVFAAAIIVELIALRVARKRALEFAREQQVKP